MNQPQDYTSAEQPYDPTGPASLQSPPFGPAPQFGPVPQVDENGRLLGYRGSDFPAPAGISPLLGPPAPIAATAAPVTPVKPRSRLGAWVAAVTVSALVGAGAGVGSYAYVAQDTPVGGSPIRVSSVPAAQSPTLDGTVAAAAAQISPSVVTIAVQSGSGDGVGSGVVLDTEGHILTNNHVVDSAIRSGTIEVTFADDRTAPASIVGTSPDSDLAVIKVDGVDNLTAAAFASSGSVRLGQAVVAVGSPLGLSESVTSGIVSTTARPVRSGNDDDAVYLAVQTDAAINPGNSGGALVDLNGAVLGINSSIATTGSAASGNIGIGFAVPADVAVRVSADLIATETSPTAAMGVSVGGSDSRLPSSDGVPLQSVTSGGAAADAGLKAGDRVRAVNDFTVGSADALIAATRFYAPGTVVEVAYVRDGADATAQVTLGTT